MIGMDDDAKLRLMQTRIIRSYAWQRDIIVPLSKEFDCSTEELEELFFDLLDMDSLENLHGTFESAEDICLYQKLNAIVVSVLHHANSSKRKITTLITIKVLVIVKNFFI